MITHEYILRVRLLGIYSLDYQNRLVYNASSIGASLFVEDGGALSVPDCGWFIQSCAIWL